MCAAGLQDLSVPREHPQQPCSSRLPKPTPELHELLKNWFRPSWTAHTYTLQFDHCSVYVSCCALHAVDAGVVADCTRRLMSYTTSTRHAMNCSGRHTIGLRASWCHHKSHSVQMAAADTCVLAQDHLPTLSFREASLLPCWTLAASRWLTL